MRAYTQCCLLLPPSLPSSLHFSFSLSLFLSRSLVPLSTYLPLLRSLAPSVSAHSLSAFTLSALSISLSLALRLCTSEVHED